ncbi:histidine kinase [Hymenobacter sp. HMF4947]|uniref:Histidine kinase n=1 Tax=Hymenobacter ginkgonis TaxID=2682976 RepID=A0A7K1TC15_9BACT|nr:histidine kinase [Hymenobacter ginkgonis]MVN75947.1 histidine kinase [Hymenobacter ginkgonis]
MELNSLRLDIQQTRIKHVLLKSQLRSMLYGVRPADAAFFGTGQNPMAQWFATTIKANYGSLPQVRELDSLLNRLLATGQALVKEYQRGQMEEARTGMGQINTYSDQFEQLLQQLEQQAN